MTARDPKGTRDERVGDEALEDQAADARDEAATAKAEEQADANATEEEEKAPKKPARRRGSAQTAPAKKTSPLPRTPEGDIAVRATARYVRCAPRKARLVVDHIRGKDVEEARAILTHTTRDASRDVLRLLDSAIANAENNHELVADELRVKQIAVNEGPTLKRYRPRALGRATRISKRTSHMTITLAPKE